MERGHGSMGKESEGTIAKRGEGDGTGWVRSETKRKRHAAYNNVQTH